MIKRKKPQKR